MTLPSVPLDDIVHQRTRLGILTIAHEARRVEFAFLQDALTLTPGNLSRHLQILEGAGLVTIEKGYEGRRPRTWVKITPRGRIALQVEINALKEIVARVDKASRTIREHPH